MIATDSVDERMGNVASLSKRLLDGHRQALARAITLVEDRAAGYTDLLAQLYPRTGKALRIGLTGPPGAGKSSLGHRLAEKLAGDGLSIGVIAVDPSSPFTGGALLGDRVRMQSLYKEPNVFIRSMATRGSAGGLAAATQDACVCIDAYGADVVLIETVGVGQIELDVASVCDTVIVVLVPESGDSIQAMKAGLVEIGDVFCLNKSDRAGSGRVRAELENVLSLRERLNPTDWDWPVVSTVATENKGIDKLWDAVQRHRSYLTQNAGSTRRPERVRADLKNILLQMAQEDVEKGLIASREFAEAVDRIVAGQTDPYSCALTLWQKRLQISKAGPE